jgi:hypothetical protein
VPLGQGVGCVEDAGQKLPLVQIEHVDREPEPMLPEYVPGGHGVHSLLVAATPSEYEPVGHLLHVEASAAEVTEDHVPAGHPTVLKEATGQ